MRKEGKGTKVLALFPGVGKGEARLRRARLGLWVD